MEAIPSRPLRNEIGEVLRRVEAGASLVISVSGRPVARLMPLENRPRSMPRATLSSALERVSADAALASELADLIPDTTDDVA